MTTQNESFSGKGRLHIDGRHVGNALVVTNANVNENVDLANFQEPGGGLYNRISRITERNLNITLSDYSEENLKIALLGTSSQTPSGSISDESVSARTPVDRLIMTASMIDTGQTVTVTSDPAGTTHVEGTDYTVSAAGITPIAGGGITAGDPLLVSYTNLDSYRVEAGTAAQLEHEIILDGTDEAQQGNPFVFRAYKVKFPAAEDVAFLSEEFGELVLAGTMLADTTQPVGKSNYFTVDKVIPS